MKPISASLPVVLAAVVFAAGAAFADPPDRPAGAGSGISIADLLGQWDEPAGDSGGGLKPEEMLKSASFGALLLFETSSREIKCTHARGPGGPSVFLICPYQHSQINKDADTYLKWESLALAGKAVFKAIEKLTVTGELKIGTSWSTLNHDVGTGNRWCITGGRATELSLVSNAGFPHFGLKLDAVFKIADAFSAGGGWSLCYGTGNIDPSAFFWVACAKGFYSFTEQRFYVKAQYETPFANPYAGFEIAFHNGWAELKDRDGASGTYNWVWLLDFRETQVFSLFLGAEKKFDAGHYIRLEFSLIGTTAARLTLGFML